MISFFRNAASKVVTLASDKVGRRAGGFRMGGGEWGAKAGKGEAWCCLAESTTSALP
jgi:hypothetical protein